LTAPSSPAARSLPRLLKASPYEAIAPVYDELLGDRFFQQSRRTFEWAERRYALRFASSADVGCGTGTFVAYLCSRSVHAVWGVDQSPAMLAQAIVKNAGNGARFLLQDLRTLRLPYPVDLLTCQFDTLNYLLTTADLRTALAAFARALRPGGHALFDMVTQRSIESGRRTRLERARSPGHTVIRRTQYDLRRRLQAAHVRVTDSSTTRCETHLQRVYTVDEVAAALDGSGLRLRGAHDFYYVPRPARHAERAIFLARRTLADVSGLAAECRR
jgi:SAM-dependent methyltransferase